MSTFTINFTNNSSSAGNFCVFNQKDDSFNSFPLAWRVESAAPKAKVAISWNTDLFFFWAKTGGLRPGMVFNAGGNAPTSLTADNEITVTRDNRDYRFVNQRTGYRQGTLVAIADSSVVPNNASIAIGMSGAATLAVQAQPNMQFQFVPRFEYWVTFGDLQQGQLLDPDGNTEAAKIDFPPGIYTMNVTLNPDFTWAITPGLD
ncbi:hypothetical protein SAMN04487996_13235 [Dyadobacter soli]|uniref:Protein rhiA n=1 Tax=Dyadobacter soli TaxID=659014 RepID=A0A1G8AVR4_9BACT|nr:hypothetical protein [Dyadobacter soli]SDH25059.1 hypothetical protein SAMN04487996_13235 [Dyadobacter soli]